ncbi:hypothetical protein Q6348_11625 [Isoptericola sp. b441]|uniref:Electron transfer flavoprotein small subunit n=1 Tax=Actinotalea lenta TaxID=3064654 RepID=A0ABT9DC07_9CELL|nr:hypothetical protein [Isoptericola sp. b441]MDO8107844.1 hypothetical protein [Isoptericola sp. b441]
MLKPVLDVGELRYNRDRNVLERDRARLVLNPEDATAVAMALELKRADPAATIEVVSMAPRRAMPHLEDLVRRGVDQATLLTDRRHAGSDTWATSRVLAHHLATRDFDLVLCGTHTLDSGTGQVPAQVAEALDLPLMAGVAELVDLNTEEGWAVVDVDAEDVVLRFRVGLPAVLAFRYAPSRTLPPIGYGDLTRDVAGQVAVLGFDALGMDESELGLRGSLTQVRRIETDALEAKDPIRVRADREGIDEVFRTLAEKGFLCR